MSMMTILVFNFLHLQRGNFRWRSVSIRLPINIVYMAFSWLLIDSGRVQPTVGGTILRQVGLGYVKGSGSKPVSSVPQFLLPVGGLSPNLLDDGLWLVREDKPFSLQIALVMIFTTEYITCCYQQCSITEQFNKKVSMTKSFIPS